MGRKEWDLIAWGWLTVWAIVAVVLRHRLAATLGRAGRPISWWRRGPGSVERAYSEWCEQQGTNPMPALRRMRFCILIGVLGMIGIIELANR